MLPNLDSKKTQKEPTDSLTGLCSPNLSDKIRQCCVSYKNQSIVLLCKTIDWFLYGTQHWVEMGYYCYLSWLSFSSFVSYFYFNFFFSYQKMSQTLFKCLYTKTISLLWMIIFLSHKSFFEKETIPKLHYVMWFLCNERI